MKKALITGITGQDGAYLAKFLLSKDYEVFGAFRRTASSNTDRLKYLGVLDQVQLVPIELLEYSNICRVLEKTQPDEIYNLASQSFVALSFEEPLFTSDVTALGTLRLLEAIRSIVPHTRFYQASSSEMFGKAQEVPQTEKTPFYPRSPYAVSKLFSHWVTVGYRDSYGIFACSGILYNHESPLRGLEFVTRKISYSVARIKLGLQDCLELGSLDSKRDWGYSPEYVEAMWLMLQQDSPDNYVVATSRASSIRDFVEEAFKCIGTKVKWSGSGIDEVGIDEATGAVLVRVDPKYFRPSDVSLLLGDFSKARSILGWSPKTSLEELISIMVESDLRLVEFEKDKFCKVG